MKLTMKNGLGVIKEVKVGWSWTTLFFGALTPLVRGDFKWFFIQTLMAILTYGLSHFVFAAIYNKIYIKGLLNEGYKPLTDEGEGYLRSKGYII